MRTLLRARAAAAALLAAVATVAGAAVARRAQPPTPLFGAAPPRLKASANQWVVSNGRVQRTIVYDAAKKGFYTVSLRDLADKTELLSAPGSAGVFGFGKGAKPDRLIDLGRDFKPASPPHQWEPNPAVKGGGAWTLTLFAEGTGPNKGFNVRIHYDVYPGTEPWMTKWYTVVNKTGSEMPWQSLLYDALPLAGGKKQAFRWPKFSSLCLVHDGQRPGGVGAAVGNYNFLTQLSKQGVLEAGLNPQVYLDHYLKGRGGRTTKSILVVYRGPPEAGTWTHQLFLIHRWIAMPHPRHTRQMYSTYRGIGGISPNAGHIARIAPKARRCGFAGVFSCTLFHRHFDRPRSGVKLDGEKMKARLADYVRQAEICKAHGLFLGLHTYGYQSYALCCGDQVDAAARRVGEILSSTDCKYLWYEDPGRPFSCIGKFRGAAQVGCADSASHGLSDKDHKLEWREGWARLADRLRKASAGVVLHRSWTWCAELLNESEMTSITDIGDNHGRKSMDRWRDFLIRRALIWPLLTNMPGAGGTTDGSEYELANSAFIAPMMLGGRGLARISDPQADLVKKWLAWNWANRELIQYSQPLAGTCGGKPFPTFPAPAGAGGVSGLMHLGPVHNGSAGFVGLWNTDDGQARKVTVDIAPQTYFLAVDARKLKIVGLREGRTYPFEVAGGAVRVAEFEIPAAKWEILDLRVE